MSAAENAGVALKQELETKPKLDMALWQIEQELAELMDFASSAESQEELEAAMTAVAEYVVREIAKVDGIRAYYRHCEVMASAAREEADRQTERAKAWEKRADRLKQTIKAVMETSGKKKLEGHTGVLQIKGNGGKAPVIITEPSLLPEEYVQYEGRIAGPLWQSILDRCEPWLHMQPTSDLYLVRKPKLSAIGDAIKAGTVVPGAYVDERGTHLEVK